MLISVIIPTFNRKNELLKTLDSLAKQSYKDFEVVVAIDGSDDGTKQALEKSSYPFELRFYWQENKGRSAARNLGIKNAKGQIVVFIDDHIFTDVNFLEQHYLEHCNYKNIIVRGSAFLVKDLLEIEQKKEFFLKKVKLDNEKYQDKFFKNPFQYFFTGNVSVPYDFLLKTGGFDENFKEYGFQDSEMGYRLIKAGLKIKINSNAIVYVFSVKHDFLKKCDRARQVGHSAVVLFRKYRHLGLYAGVNPLNLVIYFILKPFEKLLLKLREKRVKKNKNVKKLEALIKHYYFCLGIFEKLFGTKSLKKYYNEKTKS